MLGLNPIKLMPARERVASALRKAIISKQIKEGEVLGLESTAQELGVSVTPVREAFQILERDGLISLKQNKGAVVLGLTRQRLKEHYQVRAALESEACALCASSDADLKAVRNVLEASRKAIADNNFENYPNLNQSFHFEIWSATGNEKLKKLLSELWNGLSIGAETTQAEYARKSIEEHEKIFSYIEKRDSEGARREMHSHIMRSLDDILTRY